MNDRLKEIEEQYEKGHKFGDLGYLLALVKRQGEVVSLAQRMMDTFSPMGLTVALGSGFVVEMARALAGLYEA